MALMPKPSTATRMGAEAEDIARAAGREEDKVWPELEKCSQRFVTYKARVGETGDSTGGRWKDHWLPPRKTWSTPLPSSLARAGRKTARGPASGFRPRRLVLPGRALPLERRRAWPASGRVPGQGMRERRGCASCSVQCERAWCPLWPPTARPRCRRSQENGAVLGAPLPCWGRGLRVRCSSSGPVLRMDLLMTLDEPSPFRNASSSILLSPLVPQIPLRQNEQIARKQRLTLPSLRSLNLPGLSGGLTPFSSSPSIQPSTFQRRQTRSSSSTLDVPPAPSRMFSLTETLQGLGSRVPGAGGWMALPSEVESSADERGGRSRGVKVRPPRFANQLLPQLTSTMFSPGSGMRLLSSSCEATRTWWSPDFVPLSPLPCSEPSLTRRRASQVLELRTLFSSQDPPSRGYGSDGIAGRRRCQVLRLETTHLHARQVGRR